MLSPECVCFPVFPCGHSPTQYMVHRPPGVLMIVDDLFVAGAGGSGGGGQGGTATSGFDHAAGLPNTGGGGGGPAGEGVVGASNSGAGGSGVVIVRYAANR